MANAFRSIVGGSVGAQLVTALAGILLARSFSPYAFSQLGTYASIASLVAVVSGLRMDHIAFTETKPNRHGMFFSFAIVSTLALSVTSGLIIGLLGKIGLLLETSVILAIAFSLLTSLYYQFTQRELYTGRYQGFAKIRMVQAVLYGVCPLLLIRIAGEAGLIAGALSSLSLTIIYYLWANRKNIRFDLLNSFLLFRIHWKSSLQNSVTTILQYSTPFAPIFLGSGFEDKSQIGAYFLFSQMIAAPFSVVRRSLINYFNSRLSAANRAKEIIIENRTRIYKYIALLLLLMGAAILVLISFQTSVVRVVLGEKWVPLGFLVAPLFFYFAVDCILQPITTLLPHWGATRHLFFLEFLRFIIVYGVGSILILFVGLSFFEYLLFFFASMIFIYLLEGLTAASRLKSEIRST
jgi:O-antigen/teichoic acid export membrane protein